MYLDAKVWHVPISSRDGRSAPNQKMKHEADSCTTCVASPLAGKKVEGGILNFIYLDKVHNVLDFDNHNPDKNGTLYFKQEDWKGCHIETTSGKGYHVFVTGATEMAGGKGIDVLAQRDKGPQLVYIAGTHGGVTNEGYAILQEGEWQPYRGQLDSVLRTQKVKKVPTLWADKGKHKKANCLKCKPAFLRSGHGGYEVNELQDRSSMVASLVAREYKNKLVFPQSGVDEVTGFVHNLYTSYTCEEHWDNKCEPEFAANDAKNILRKLGKILDLPTLDVHKPTPIGRRSFFWSDRAFILLSGWMKVGKAWELFFHVIPDWVEATGLPIIYVSIDEDSATLRAYAEHFGFDLYAFGGERVGLYNNVNEIISEAKYESQYDDCLIILDGFAAMSGIREGGDQYRAVYREMSRLRAVHKEQLLFVVHPAGSRKDEKEMSGTGAASYGAGVRAGAAVTLVRKTPKTLTHCVTMQGNRAAPISVTRTYIWDSESVEGDLPTSCVEGIPEDKTVTSFCELLSKGSTEYTHALQAHLEELGIAHLFDIGDVLITYKPLGIWTDSEGNIVYGGSFEDKFEQSVVAQ